MANKTKRELKEVVETHLGYSLKWIDNEWNGGSAWADLPDGRWVSVMQDPPEGTPQIGGITVDQPKQSKGGQNWQVTKSLQQMKMIFT